VDLPLELLLSGEVVVCVVLQIVQRLDSHGLVIALLAALHDCVDLLDELFVLRVDHLISCYQIICKFCIHNFSSLKYTFMAKVSDPLYRDHTGWWERLGAFLDEGTYTNG